MKVVLAYLIAVNVLTFEVYGVDKWKAKKKRWRIPEAHLLLLAAFGGSLGAWCGMRVWHHKTLHRKFRYGIPAFIILQIAFTVYILQKVEVF